jgi:hypothetical protein
MSGNRNSFQLFWLGLCACRVCALRCVVCGVYWSIVVSPTFLGLAQMISILEGSPPLCFGSLAPVCRLLPTSEKRGIGANISLVVMTF